MTFPNTPEYTDEDWMHHHRRIGNIITYITPEEIKAFTDGLIPASFVARLFLHHTNEGEPF